MLETGFPVVALITLPLMAEAKGKGMPPITRRATQTANGEIAEEGDWYGLLKQEGLLANYHKLQSWEASRPKDVAENQKIPQSR